jgi:hypothetical protein
MLSSTAKKVTDYIRYRMTVRNWNKKGNPIPVPDVVKQRAVKKYAKIFSRFTIFTTRFRSLICQIIVFTNTTKITDT